MSEKDYYKEFVNFETDYLITLRARGAELNEEAHAAIEKIATERGEKLPPKPSQFLDIKLSYKKPTQNKSFNWLHFTLVVLAGSIGGVIGRELAKENSVFGTGVSLLIFLILAYPFLSRNVSKKAKEAYKKQKEIEGKGLTELIVCAADGELDKVRDLVNYKKVDLNRTCFSGSTALMYAVRNNHFEIAKFLIDNGADILIKNRSSQTAKSIAEKYANEKIKALFQQ